MNEQRCLAAYYTIVLRRFPPVFSLPAYFLQMVRKSNESFDNAVGIGYTFIIMPNPRKGEHMENAIDVIISISGLQDAGTPDNIEFVTCGNYCFEKGCIRISYQESELTGLEGTQTTITVTPEGVFLTREGTMTTCMKFIEGQRDSFLYDTPFGSATMTIDTNRIRTAFSPHGGVMEIDYVIDIDHSLVNRSKFRLNVREQGK